MLACHRESRSKLSGLTGYLWEKGLVQPLHEFPPSQRPQHLSQMQPRAPKGWQQAPQFLPPATDSRVAPAQLCLEVWSASHKPRSLTGKPSRCPCQASLAWCSQGNSFAFVCLVPRQPSLGSMRLCAVRAWDRLPVVPSASYKRAPLTREGPQGCLQGEKPSLNTCIRPVPT